MSLKKYVIALALCALVHDAMAAKRCSAGMRAYILKYGSLGIRPSKKAREYRFSEQHPIITGFLLFVVAGAAVQPLLVESYREQHHNYHPEQTPVQQPSNITGEDAS